MQASPAMAHTSALTMSFLLSCDHHPKKQCLDIPKIYLDDNDACMFETALLNWIVPKEQVDHSLLDTCNLIPGTDMHRN